MSRFKLYLSFMFFLFVNILNSQEYIDKKNFGESRINDIKIFNDSIFYLTEQGLFLQKLNFKPFQNTFGRERYYSVESVRGRKFFFSKNAIYVADSLSNIVPFVDLPCIEKYSYVSSTCVDKSNTIYLASSKSTIYKIKIDSTLDVDSMSIKLECHSINQLFSDVGNNRVWVATDRGLYYFQDTVFIPRKAILIDEPIFSITKMNSNLYLGGRGKIINYSMPSTTIKKSYLCEDKIILKLFVVNNSIWFLCDDFIGAYDGDYDYRLAKLISGFNKSTMATCATAYGEKNKVYVGTQSMGVFVFGESNLSRSTCFLCDSLGDEGVKQKSVEMSYEKEFNIGINRTFFLEWNLKKNKDRIQIFEGDKLLHDTGFVNKKNNTPNLTTSKATIRVVITSKVKKGTRYGYKIKCIN